LKIKLEPPLYPRYKPGLRRCSLIVNLKGEPPVLYKKRGDIGYYPEELHLLSPYDGYLYYPFTKLHRLPPFVSIEFFRLHSFIITFGK